MSRHSTPGTDSNTGCQLVAEFRAEVREYLRLTYALKARKDEFHLHSTTDRNGDLKPEYARILTETYVVQAMGRYLEAQMVDLGLTVRPGVARKVPGSNVKGSDYTGSDGSDGE